jgi:hypothetical protein
MMKPSERIVKSSYDGKDIKDSEGRIIKLRKPKLLDVYDLMKALGDDAKNSACLGMAYNTLYAGMIDGMIIECPKTYREVRAILQRLDEHGMAAIAQALAYIEENKTEQEQLEAAKK